MCSDSPTCVDQFFFPPVNQLFQGKGCNVSCLLANPSHFKFIVPVGSHVSSFRSKIPRNSTNRLNWKEETVLYSTLQYYITSFLWLLRQCVGIGGFHNFILNIHHNFQFGMMQRKISSSFDNFSSFHSLLLEVGKKDTQIYYWHDELL